MKKTDNNKIILYNKKIKYNYQIVEKYEAGIILKGSEIKSIRLGKISFSDSFVSIDKNLEAFILNLEIAKFDKSSYLNHLEKRKRKLLLNKREIIKINQKVKEQSLTIIPEKIYFKFGLAKLSICLCKGNSKIDKRNIIKERDIKKRTEKALKNYGKN